MYRVSFWPEEGDDVPICDQQHVEQVLDASLACRGSDVENTGWRGRGNEGSCGCFP